MQHKIAHTDPQTLGNLEVTKLKTLNYTIYCDYFHYAYYNQDLKCWTRIKIEIT